MVRDVRLLGACHSAVLTPGLYVLHPLLRLIPMSTCQHQLQCQLLQPQHKFGWHVAVTRCVSSYPAPWQGTRPGRSGAAQ